MNRIRLAWGFTLIELMITLAILAVLATVAVPVAQTVTQREREHELQRDLVEIRTAIDEYKRAGDEGHMVKIVGASGYPKSLQVLVDGVEDIRDPNNAKIYFLRNIPQDPMNPEGSVSGADSWGLRSYESEAADPQAGDDVYDVYSKSAEIGLNGIAYRQW